MVRKNKKITKNGNPVQLVWKQGGYRWYCLRVITQLAHWEKNNNLRDTKISRNMPEVSVFWKQSIW